MLLSESFQQIANSVSAAISGATGDSSSSADMTNLVDTAAASMAAASSMGAEASESMATKGGAVMEGSLLRRVLVKILEQLSKL